MYASNNASGSANSTTFVLPGWNYFVTTLPINGMGYFLYDEGSRTRSVSKSKQIQTKFVNKSASLGHLSRRELGKMNDVNNRKTQWSCVSKNENKRITCPCVRSSTARVRYVACKKQ